MRIWLFKCPSCGYESRHPLGSPDSDQILTDVNTEFAEFRLFLCKKESKFIHIDVYEENFKPICPADGTELTPAVAQQQEGKNNLPDKCPRCGQNLTVESIKPLAADSSTD